MDVWGDVDGFLQQVLKLKMFRLDAKCLEECRDVSCTET